MCKKIGLKLGQLRKNAKNITGKGRHNLEN